MPHRKNVLSVLIADDHPLFRKGVEDIIRTTEYASANILFASNGQEAVRVCTNNAIDLIFLDVNMPEMNGYDAAEAILEARPTLPIIVLTQFDEIPLILNLFKTGAKGFLTKNIEGAEIAAAMTSVLKGDYYYHSKFDDTISSWLMSGLRKQIPSVRFSEREMQLIMLMSKGKTTQEISEQLGLSFRSIETYRYQLIKKINVANTAELITYVYKNSIL
ncbi:MAG: response regulator transcription factor [Bacteroidota bacterium]